MRNPSTTTYLPALDGLRAAAIGVVLLGHFTHYSFVPGGFGVTLFFFISGLLITRLLLAELDSKNTIDLRSFYTRRILRLFPALMTMVLIVMLVQFYYTHSAPLGDAAATLFYYANYYRIFGGFTTVLALMWSLAVEEHYYMIFPTVLRPLMRGGRPLLVLSGAALLALVWRTCLMLFIHPPVDYTYMATDTRFDSILYGAIFSIWLHKKPDIVGNRHWLTSPIVFGLGITVLLVCFLMKGLIIRETLRYSLQGLALIPVIGAIIFSDRLLIYKLGRAILAWRPMIFVGRLSYSLYLWHYGLIWFVPLAMPHLAPRLALMVAFLLSIVVSSLSYFGVERAFLNLRHRFGSHAR